MPMVIGGGLFLLGLSITIKGLRSDKGYSIWLCVLGVFLGGQGLIMLGVF